MKQSAVRLMYHALLQIAAIDTTVNSLPWCVARAQTIAMEAVKRMNLEHASEVARLLAIEKER